jgi:cyclopropane fatty-acyl-phospholipid synthase-like methyltransferase
MDLRNALAHPALFGFFNKMIGASRLRQTCAVRHIRAKPGDRILDIGCGMADILAFLPTVDYQGFDQSAAYIRAAQRRYGSRGSFFLQEFQPGMERSFSSYDFVLALGVLHHLDTPQASQLFQTARAILKPGGRFITLDGCYTENQSAVARYILAGDRGAYVRREKEYLALAQRTFAEVKPTIYNNMLRIPYTHLIMECS